MGPASRSSLFLPISAPKVHSNATYLDRATCGRAKSRNSASELDAWPANPDQRWSCLVGGFSPSLRVGGRIDRWASSFSAVVMDSSSPRIASPTLSNWANACLLRSRLSASWAAKVSAVWRSVSSNVRRNFANFFGRLVSCRCFQGGLLAPPALFSILHPLLICRLFPETCGSPRESLRPCPPSERS